MRLGLNGTAYDGLSSGARDRFLSLHAALHRRHGHELVVYSPRSMSLSPHLPESAAAADVPTPLRPGRPVVRFLRAGRWFARRAPRDGVDLFATDHFPVLSAPPTLLTIHDLRFLALRREGSLARRLYFRLRYAATAAQAAAVTTVSETMREEVVRRLGLPSDRVHVVPNGVPADLRPASPEAVAALRRSRGLPDRYLLHLGVLERRKNLTALLEALALPEGRDLPPLLLAGRGGPEERSLRRAARRLGVAGRIRFEGYVPDPDLAALLTGAAALVMPSRYEGFGLPVLQAFACGTPVVAARASALPEVAGGAALLVDPGDPAGYATALAGAIGDRRSALAESGRARARTFTWDAAADRLQAVLTSLRPPSRS